MNFVKRLFYTLRLAWRMNRKNGVYGELCLDENRIYMLIDKHCLMLIREWNSGDYEIDAMDAQEAYNYLTEGLQNQN